VRPKGQAEKKRRLLEEVKLSLRRRTTWYLKLWVGSVQVHPGSAGMMGWAPLGSALRDWWMGAAPALCPITVCTDVPRTQRSRAWAGLHPSAVLSCSSSALCCGRNRVVTPERPPPPLPALSSPSLLSCTNTSAQILTSETQTQSTARP